MIRMLRTFLNKGHKRTVLVKKNIIFSLFLKIIGMISMFLMIPISIDYLGKINYGIWVTLSGIVGWTGMFDFGFSHGLRNRLAEALAKDDYITGRYLVSSTYFFMFIIAISLTFVFSFIIDIVDWRSVLNLSDNYDMNILYATLQIIFLLFVLQFFFKPINSVLQAFQLPSVAQAIGTVGSVVILGGIAFLYYFQILPALTHYAYVVAGTPVLLLFVSSIYLFNKKFYQLKPSLQFIKLKFVKSVSGLGLTFFIIQLAVLVVYSSDNLIISYLFGPKEVTTYNVVYKYFSLLTIFFAVVMSPFWSAITDAYAKGEMIWIRKTIKSLLMILCVGAVVSFFLFFIAHPIFSLWIGKDFVVPTSLVALMAVYAVAMAWVNIFSFFSNGIGKIRLQLYAYIFAAVINIPMSYYFGKILQMGNSGVLLATIISMSIVGSLLTIQYIMIISNRAKGIFLK